MKTYFKDLFEYQHAMNQKTILLCMSHGDKLTERTQGLLFHNQKAHKIWNCRILNQEFADQRQIYNWDEMLKEVLLNFKNTIQILDDRDLNEQISYKTSHGELFQNTIQEIMTHVSNHHSHHRAQVISDLRQQGIQPPVTDYIFYKREK